MPSSETCFRAACPGLCRRLAARGVGRASLRHGDCENVRRARLARTAALPRQD